MKTFKDFLTEAGAVLGPEGLSFPDKLPKGARAFGIGDFGGQEEEPEPRWKQAKEDSPEKEKLYAATKGVIESMGRNIRFLSYTVGNLERRDRDEVRREIEDMMDNLEIILSSPMQEIAGATGIVYDGSKEGPDWQYEGDPESMIKPKKKMKTFKEWLNEHEL